jgi:hypothetical protein
MGIAPIQLLFIVIDIPVAYVNAADKRGTAIYHNYFAVIAVIGTV